jgi:hypothetical protein
LNRKCIKAPAFLPSRVKPSLVCNSSIALTMAFKKSFAALICTLPLVFGMNLFSSKNVDSLTMVAASPAKRTVSTQCAFLEPIKQDLLENLFENECGDAVSFFSLHYEHLSNDHTGSWCLASVLPRRHWNLPNLRVILFTLLLPRPI